MASLEELLAEEGFRGRKSSGMRSRASFRADTAGFYPFRDKGKTDSPSSSSGQRARSRMDLLKYKERSNSSRTSRDGPVRRDQKFGGRSTTTTTTTNWDRLSHERGSNGVREDKKKAFVGRTRRDDDDEDSEELEDEKVKDIYSDKGYSTGRSESSGKGSGEIERYEEGRRKNVAMDARRGGNLHKHLLQKYAGSGSGSGNGSRRSGLGHRDPSQGGSIRDSSRDSRSFENEDDDDDRPRPRQGNAQTMSSQVSLDEVAVQAMVSILNGYIKRFFKDKEFRVALHADCLSSFGITEMEQDHVAESKVITTLEHAIETAEQAVDDPELASVKELKKACLQLTIITGLNSNETKDGYTCGVPNSRLSACAHIYLSVMYKLQKKDRVSAKHLLQVFCDSPSLARSLLLPQLWEYLFLPHLSHLRVWYDQEAESLENSPSRIRKLKLLDKVYNEILDSGTYQFAAYYKDWLTEGVEAPTIPSICAPTMSVQEVRYVGLSQDRSFGTDSPSSPFSPQPMVSKKLYESVFGRFAKSGDHEAGSSGEVDNFDDYASCSDGSTSEVKKTLPCSSEIVKHLDEDSVDPSSKDSQDQALVPDHLMLSASDKERNPVRVSVAPKSDAQEETTDSNTWRDAAGIAEMRSASLQGSDNELALKSLAKSAFEPQEKEEYDDLANSIISHSEIPRGKASDEDICTNYDCVDEDLSVSGVPSYFICPLTRRLFKDPVTLETGETFEREAIIEWFNHGTRTCPATGKALECQTVPSTNSILKRLVDSWKSEHCSHLLASASLMAVDTSGYQSRRKDQTTMIMLEEIVTCFGKEERLTSSRHLISLGGLEFLIRSFKSGDTEEKARVATLFCSCIEASSSCRIQIVESIDKQGLIELLCSKDPKFREKAVHLLVELICLSRRKVSAMFLSGLESEEIVNIMHILLVYLQSCPLEERPSVAVLLLHLDLLAEPRKYSVYREEAVDAIVAALEGGLADEKVRVQCCRSLLVLGGRFSASGKLLTENWILKQAGFNNVYELDNVEDNVQPDNYVLLDSEEEEDYEEWLRNLAASLLGNGKRSFLDITSKCLGSKNTDLVGVCLTTVAWLSGALSSSSEADVHLSAFSALISGLKESLEHGVRTEHKVLASVSLLNFSKISECRVLLMTIAEEIEAPLRDIARVTWTARQLYSIIIGEDL